MDLGDGACLLRSTQELCSFRVLLATCFEERIGMSTKSKSWRDKESCPSFAHCTTLTVSTVRGCPPQAGFNIFFG